jgi:hypothetical protein
MLPDDMLSNEDNQKQLVNDQKKLISEIDVKLEQLYVIVRKEQTIVLSTDTELDGIERESTHDKVLQMKEKIEHILDLYAKSRDESVSEPSEDDDSGSDVLVSDDRSETSENAADEVDVQIVSQEADDDVSGSDRIYDSDSIFGPGTSENAADEVDVQIVSQEADDDVSGSDRNSIFGSGTSENSAEEANDDVSESDVSESDVSESDQSSPCDTPPGKRSRWQVRNHSPDSD